MENENEQTQKRTRGRPRKYPPKPKLTKEEVSRIRSENGKRGALTRLKNGTCRGGRPSGTSGEGYHRKDNIAVGEPRETMTVLKSSADVFRSLANSKNIPLIAAVKSVTDVLVRQNPEVFGRPSAPKEM